MHRMQRFISIVAATVIAAVPALALELGDPAPDLSIAEWVKGDPVVLNAGKGKNIYVIEFWQTADPHSRASIPHLTKLQEKYRDEDVVVIAITNEAPDAVKDFVGKMDAQMAYRVAIDKNQRTGTQYMEGFHLNTIPRAFLIDKNGNIVWHGHPKFGLSKAVGALIAGTYDIEVQRRVEKARGLIGQYFYMVASPTRAGQVGELGDQIIADGGSDASLMNDFAWMIVSRPGLIKRDLDLAMRAAQAAYDASAGNDGGILDTYARVLFETGKKKEAIEHQKRAIELAEGEEQRKEFEKRLAAYVKEAGGG
jgi:thiol-disulfide isomerase/thioredoxin